MLVPITIVRRTPHRHDEVVKQMFEAFHGELMCACNKVKTVVMHECLRDVPSKEKASSSWGKAPTLNVYTIVRNSKRI